MTKAMTFLHSTDIEHALNINIVDIHRIVLDERTARLDFIAHQTSDHHGSASPQLGEVLAGIKLEWVDPIQGSSPLTPTDAQDAPADASELVRTYARRYAAQVADWWLPLRD